MESIDEIKKHFKNTLLRFSSKEILVLKGLIAGDGDIGGRMASSHPDAKPPVDKQKMEILKGIAELHRELNTPLDEIEEIHGWASYSKTNE
jgi:hypothetical protein